MLSAVSATSAAAPEPVRPERTRATTEVAPATESVTAPVMPAAAAEIQAEARPIEAWSDPDAPAMPAPPVSPAPAHPTRLLDPACLRHRRLHAGGIGPKRRSRARRRGRAAE